MGKKVSWLDAFAESQAKKLEKTASVKEAQHFVVDAEDIEDAQECIKEGSQVKYKGEKYTVINASFSDEVGKGVVLEKYADDESVVSNNIEPVVEQPAAAAPVEQPGEEVATQEEQGGNNVMAKKDIRSQYLKKVAEELFKKDEEEVLEDEDEVEDTEEKPEVDAVEEEPEEFKELDIETNEPLPTEEVVEPEAVAPVSAPMSAPASAPVAGGQEYARQPYQGPIYDTNVREVEQAKFEGEAAETANKINSDNAVDRTNVQGRYSSNSILNAIVNSALDPMGMEMGTAGFDKAPVAEEKVASKKKK